MLLLLILIILEICLSKSIMKDPTRMSSAQALEPLAKYLRKHDKNFKSYSEGEVVNALKRLASTQNMLKATDGATHKFNSALSQKKTSLNARYRGFLKNPDVRRSSRLRYVFVCVCVCCCYCLL